MYQSFWNLNRRPFEEVSSMADHFESESHQAAILKLRYLVEQRKGLALLIGEHGLGKTHLTRVFAEELQEQDSGPVVRLDFPQLSPHQTLAYLAQRLGANHASATGEAAALIQLEGRLAELKHHGHHTVFVIDDAHLLEMEHLHFLRLLLNLRESGTGDFSVVLSGRAELLAKTQRLGALDQRAVIRAALAPLACEEVLPYLQHRLKAAGRPGDVFASDSAQRIWEITQGIPRRVNQLGDLALLVGYADNLAQLGPLEIEAAAEELISIAA